MSGEGDSISRGGGTIYPRVYCPGDNIYPRVYCPGDNIA